MILFLSNSRKGKCSDRKVVQWLSWPRNGEGETEDI